MENTSPSENNIPISTIIVVREATQPSTQEDIENSNQPTGLSNQEDLQNQDDNQSSLGQEIGYWNVLYALVILGICVAWTSTVTTIPIHNIYEYPEFWW